MIANSPARGVFLPRAGIFLLNKQSLTMLFAVFGGGAAEVFFENRRKVRRRAVPEVCRYRRGRFIGKAQKAFAFVQLLLLNEFGERHA